MVLASRDVPRPDSGPLELPRLGEQLVGSTALPLVVTPEWKAQQRLWGHAFHPMCSYLAAFPAAIAHAFVARYSRPGDVVLDPFSGRGTTPLQACAEGRIGVGNDLNPLAHLLTAAKVDPPTPTALVERLEALREHWRREETTWLEYSWEAAGSDGPGGVPALPAWGVRPAATHSTLGPAAAGLAAASATAPSPRGPATSLPAEVAVCFHPRTLAQLLFLRASLDPVTRADRFIAAATLGVLHGRSESYLSPIMPNTFSMPPGYVRDYARRTGFTPPKRDVFDALAAKTRRLLRQGLPPTRGLALLGDARDASPRVRAALRSRALPDRARLVVTSPPYLRVVRYGSYNWLRLWFLGIDPATVDAALDDTHRIGTYLPFLRAVLGDMRSILADDAVVVLVIGDVARDRGRTYPAGLGLAETAWEACAEPEGYRLAGIVPDAIAAHRKMTKIWGSEAGRATRTDRLLVLAPTEIGRRRALAAASSPVDWRWPPRAWRGLGLPSGGARTQSHRRARAIRG